MAEFSIQEVAFTGFRVVREHPRVLAIWAVLAGVAALTVTAVLVGSAGPEFARLEQFGAIGSRDPALAIAALGKLLPVYLLLTPLALVYYAVVYAGMNRIVLRPGDAKWGYLRFGPDEFRQMVLILLLFLISVSVYIVFLVFVFIVGLLLHLIANVGPNVIVSIALLGLVTVFAIFAVRLSLASAVTFASRRVNVFGSWSLTRGRFWPILGTYLLTLCLSAVVLVLTGLITLAAVAAVTGGNLSGSMAPADMSSLGAYFTAARLAQLVFGAGLSALIWPLMLTPPAAIYRHLTAGHAAPTDRVSA